MILSCKALSKRDKDFHVKHYPKEINLKIRIRCELTAIDVYDSLRYHSKVGITLSRATVAAAAVTNYRIGLAPRRRTCMYLLSLACQLSFILLSSSA